MSEYLHWYLVELRNRLDPKLPQRKVHEILSETEDHLKESARELAEEFGWNENDSMLAAIQSYGDPEKVALSHLAASDPKFWGVPPIWVIFGSALVAIWCWNFEWLSLRGFFDHFGETWENGFVATLGVFALVTFFRACRAGYRSYRKEVMQLGFVTAFGLVFLMSTWMISVPDQWQGISRFHINREEKNLWSNLTALNRIEDLCELGRNKFGQAADPGQIPFQFEITADLRGAYDHILSLNRGKSPTVSQMEQTVVNSYIVPGSVIFVTPSKPLWFFQQEDRFDVARKRWAASGPSTQKAIQGARDEINLYLAAIAQARSGRIFFFDSRVYGKPVVLTLLFLPALLLLEAVAYNRSRRRSPLPVRVIA
ncbi:MAG: hypothetical protein BGO01_04905 [Armatimonadetes bacterium 55-13]|nr:hypothetical protein [Armatimonadota bacterium]OJU61427.1 MAG: hypothetical protein BGO01_04905 [Armatimonadetes bacterium 55-13]